MERPVGLETDNTLPHYTLKYSEADISFTCSHRPMNVEDGLDHTLEDLGLEYLDLYLMHWPVTKSIISGRSSPEYVAVSPPALDVFVCKG